MIERRLFLASTFCALATLTAPGAIAAAFSPTRFSVVVRGSGPDVAILIPGLTESADIWNATVAAVPGYRYHLVRIAGFAGYPARGNASGKVVGPLAEELYRYIDEAGLVRPALVGHSMGGTVGLMLAARHPHLLGKVMVVDMLPQPAGLLGGTASGMSGLLDALDGLSASAGGRQLVGSLIGMFGNPQANGRSDPDVVARAARELASIDLTPELRRIADPLTVLYALPHANSGVDAGEISRGFREAYASARTAKLVPIHDSGHLIMYDQPRAFYSALRSFLSISP